MVTRIDPEAVLQRGVFYLAFLSVISFCAFASMPARAMGQSPESEESLQARKILAPLHGVTVADHYDVRSPDYLNLVIPALSNLEVTPSVRLVFTLEVDSGGQGATGSSYYSAVEQIKASTNHHTGRHPVVMGQPVDSSYMICFTRADHARRWKDFVEHLGKVVDFWEVGNEINGNWTYNTGADEAADGLTFCPTDLPASADPLHLGGHVRQQQAQEWHGLRPDQLLPGRDGMRLWSAACGGFGELVPGHPTAFPKRQGGAR
jgi:hypothetical protein